jgi:hypothetical protein
MVSVLIPVELSHYFLIPVLIQGGRSRIGDPGVTVHQAKQDRLRPSSASRQSYAKFEAQKKSVSLRGQIWVGRVEGRACLAGAHGCYCW